MAEHDREAITLDLLARYPDTLQRGMVIGELVTHISQDALGRFLAADKIKAGADVDALRVDVIDRLDKTYQLVYLGRDDHLQPNQVQVLLDGGNPYESREFTPIEEWELDQRADTATDAIKDVTSEEEFDLLFEDRDALDQVMQEVYERDTSGVVGDLLANTYAMLFRYSLDFDADTTFTSDEDDTDAERADIIAALGLDATDQSVQAKVADLVAEASYGGRLEILFYADPEVAYELALGARFRQDHDPEAASHQVGTVTFTNAHVLIRDGLNGSGFEIEFDAITVPWHTKRVQADEAKGGGYSWAEIAGPYPSAYAGAITMTKTAPPTDPEEPSRG